MIKSSSHKRVPPEKTAHAVQTALPSPQRSEKHAMPSAFGATQLLSPVWKDRQSSVHPQSLGHAARWTPEALPLTLEMQLHQSSWICLAVLMCRVQGWLRQVRAPNFSFEVGRNAAASLNALRI